MPSAPVDLVAVDRGQLREATHQGHLVVVDAAGRLEAALGDPDRPTYYRSSAKPLQALAMLRAGVVERFGLSAEQVAIMCAEAVWWRCHRSLISDYLKARGAEVIHILDEKKNEPHPFTSAARIVDGKLSYANDCLL